jgi:hypothetical protein
MYQFVFDTTSILGPIFFGLFVAIVFTRHKKAALLCLAISLVLIAVAIVTSYKKNSEPQSTSPQQIVQLNDSLTPKHDSTDTKKSKPHENATSKQTPRPKHQPSSSEHQGGFSFTSDKLTVVIGGNSVSHSKSYLLTHRLPALTIGSDTIAIAYAEGDKLFVDVDLPSEYHSGHPEVRVRHNSILTIPPSWDFNFSDYALEIVDKDFNPRLQIIYKLNNYITINCVFEEINIDRNGLEHRTVYCVEKNGMHFGPASMVRCSIPRMFKYPYERHKGEIVGD